MILALLLMTTAVIVLFFSPWSTLYAIFEISLLIYIGVVMVRYSIIILGKRGVERATAIAIGVISWIVFLFLFFWFALNYLNP